MWKHAKSRYFCLIKAFLIICAIPLCFSLSFGNGNTVDSLLNELKSAKEDTIKIRLFLDISWEYHTSKPQQTIAFAQRAYDLSRIINYKKGEASAFNQMGIGYDIQGELDKAMEYYEAASRLAEELNDSYGAQRYLNNMGLLHGRKGDNEKAMACFHKALQAVDQEKDKELASILLNNIGIVHSEEERHEKALEYFETSLKMARELNDPLGISMTLTNIGEEYKALGKKAKALVDYICISSSYIF